MADVFHTSCPECGQSFYPEDEPDTKSSRPLRKRSEGLVLRVFAFITIGALLGGSLSMVVGTGWVWLTILGGLIVGLVGMISFGLH
jgi:hypothetical protein